MKTHRSRPPPGVDFVNVKKSARNGPVVKKQLSGYYG